MLELLSDSQKIYPRVRAPMRQLRDLSACQGFYPRVKSPMVELKEDGFKMSLMGQGKFPTNQFVKHLLQNKLQLDIVTLSTIQLYSFP